MHCNGTFPYFQFAKWLLEGSSVAMPLDPGYEGGTIAAEVLYASGSLREFCSKCGRNLTCGACHSLLARATVNHKGHSILNVFPSHSVPITISNALCAGRQIGKTSASAVTVLPHKT